MKIEESARKGIKAVVFLLPERVMQTPHFKLGFCL